MITLYILQAYGFITPILRNRYQTSYLSAEVSNRVGGQIIDGKWYNSDYPRRDIDMWWNSINKHLLTIGVNGVKPSQINSLQALIQSHGKIRVKLASDKVDPSTIVDEIMEDEIMKSKYQPLLIRSREIMFGEIKRK